MKPSFNGDALRDLMTAGPIPDMERRIVATGTALQSAMATMRGADVGSVMGLPGAMVVAIVLRDAATAERLAKAAQSARDASAAFRDFASVLDLVAVRIEVALEARPDPSDARAYGKEQ